MLNEVLKKETRDGNYSLVTNYRHKDYNNFSYFLFAYGSIYFYVIYFLLFPVFYIQVVENKLY